MQVALYQSHHSLPFWHGPTLPNEMFDPEVHGKRVLTLRSVVPVPENWIWPVLMGLHALDLPLLAHVSAFCPCLGEGKWHFPKRVWVQITDVPPEKTPDGKPLTVRGGKALVNHLWGGDNKTYTPYEFLGSGEPPPESSRPEFWTRFFEEKLRETKAEVLQRAKQTRKATKEAATLYSLIPD